MANVVGLSSLRGDGAGSDDERAPPQNQYYAGGASGRGGGSGLSVVGPGSAGEGDGEGDAMANIVRRAQRDAAPGSSGSDAGSAAGQRRTVTFFREGFTVDDGPYRARDDPANRPFLEALERGLVPRELEGEDARQQVEVALVDRRAEDYEPPRAPAYTAFSGEGQRMGGAQVAPDAVIHGAQVPAERPVVDDKQPTTTLQLRLHDGRRLRETLNLAHRVRDLHAIIMLCVAPRQWPRLTRRLTSRCCTGTTPATSRTRCSRASRRAPCPATWTRPSRPRGSRAPPSRRSSSRQAPVDPVIATRQLNNQPTIYLLLTSTRRQRR